MVFYENLQLVVPLYQNDVKVYVNNNVGVYYDVQNCLHAIWQIESFVLMRRATLHVPTEKIDDVS